MAKRRTTGSRNSDNIEERVSILYMVIDAHVLDCAAAVFLIRSLRFRWAQLEREHHASQQKQHAPSSIRPGGQLQALRFEKSD